MRFRLFRPTHWPIALGLIALAACALAGACSLNPQPLPPEQATVQHGDDGGLNASSGSNSPAGSSGSSSGGGFGGLDAGVVQGDAPATPSIAGDASADGGNRGSADGGAAEDAASDAPPLSDAAGDAASDAPPPGDAATDGSDASDGGCTTRWDCHASFPDECNICASPLNYLACVGGACVCACRVMDAAGE
jgi:hypothetical protein